MWAPTSYWIASSIVHAWMEVGYDYTRFYNRVTNIKEEKWLYHGSSG